MRALKTLILGVLCLTVAPLSRGASASGGTTTTIDEDGKTKTSVSFEGSGEVSPFGVGILIGTVVRTDPVTGEPKTWNQIRLQPEFVYGKFGIGVDIGLEWDQNNKANREDWDEPSDAWDKILYARFGKKGSDPFAIRLGGLNQSTLGHGLIMSSFSNMNFWPDVKQLGVDLSVNTKHAGVEGILEDVDEHEIIAGRVTGRPLAAQSGILGKLGFSGSYAVDRRSTGPLSLIVADAVGNTTTVSVSNDDVVIFGADQELPLVDNSIIQVIQTFDWAQIKDYGAGFAGGFMGKLAMFDYKLEYRTMEADFFPSYFNNFYQAERQTKRFALEQVRLANAPRQSGFFGSIGSNIAGILKLSGSYEEYTSKGGGVPAQNRFLGTAEIPEKVLPKVSMKGSYSRVHIVGLWDDSTRTDFFDVFGANALISGELLYRIVEHVDVAYVYSRRYEVPQSGQGLDIIESSTIETRIKF